MSEFITASLALMPYTDATYDYVCEAPPGNPLATAYWRVKRTHKTSGRVEWVDGNGNFDNLATSLVVVAALSYS